jgi:hypothetical protein
MNFRGIVFGLIFLISAIIPSLSLCHAKPVLIKLTLEQPTDWANAISLGVVAYQRFDGLLLAEFDGEKLEELDQAGLRYRIIDEDPWSEEYFLAFPVEKAAESNLELYGKILLKEPEWHLIKTSPEKAFQFGQLGYKVVPIRRKPIPLKYEPRFKLTGPAQKYYPDLDSLVNLVSEDSLRTWVRRLQDFHTRYTFSDSIPFAREWIFDKFISFDIGDVVVDSFYYYNYMWNLGWHWVYNVKATIPGTDYPDRLIVLGGHYDSYAQGSFDDPNVPAPGADDDASGTCAVLELARIISEHPLKCTVIFIAFDAEEIWMDGSTAYVESIYSQGVELDLMINFDMIGYTDDGDPDVTIHHGKTSGPFGPIMAYAANQYTWLRPVLDNPSPSDSWPFYQYGYQVLYAEEGDFNYVGYHTPGDTIGIMDVPYMTEVVKMGLATSCLVGNSPSPVESLRAVDAGDGHTIYLSWSANPPEEGVVCYNVNFGKASGDYDSLHQIGAVCDTLHHLEEDTTYYITVTAVNSDSFESPSVYEASIAPRVVPLPPAGLTAHPDGSFKIRLDWSPNGEADFDYYNIYRSQESGSGYLLLSGEYRDTTFVDSTVQGHVECYYYTLTAVDTGANESEMSAEDSSFVVSLNQGILLVDETYINTNYNMVDGDSINDFYDRALQGYTYTYSDHSCPVCSPANQVDLRELGRYSVVIVHSEDHRGNRSMGAYGDSTYLVLKEYLSFGGKAIIEGRRNLSKGNDGELAIRQFLPGDVPYDYLRVKAAYVPPWSPASRSEEFIGAFSQTFGYPNLDVDSLRVDQCGSGLEFGGRVPGVGYLDSLMDGEIIYTFHSAYDTSASEGKPVAFRYFGDDYKLIFFDFPLYFIQETQATQLLHQALDDLEVTTDVAAEEEETKVPASFSLSQNHPNPFNSETAIEYSLPEETQVKIAIYNILGQKVKTLLDGKETAGHKRVIWDGENEKGKSVSSGIYFYRMETEEFVQTKKMLFLK